MPLTHSTQIKSPKVSMVCFLNTNLESTKIHTAKTSFPSHSFAFTWFHTIRRRRKKKKKIFYSYYIITTLKIKDLMYQEEQSKEKTNEWRIESLAYFTSLAFTSRAERNGISHPATPGLQLDLQYKRTIWASVHESRLRYLPDLVTTWLWPYTAFFPFPSLRFFHILKVEIIELVHFF